MHKFISRLCIDVIRDLLQQNNLFKIVFVYTIGTSMFIVYFSPLLWSKTTLISSIFGRTRTGLDPHMYKMKTMFLMSLAIIVAIFFTKNLIRHELWKLSNFGQNLKISTARIRWDFLLKIDKLRAKYMRKIVLIFYQGTFAPFPLNTVSN